MPTLSVGRTEERDRGVARRPGGLPHNTTWQHPYLNNPDIVLWGRLLTGGGLVTRPGPINNRTQVDNLSHKAAANNSSGVTLIELLVVVALISIMVGITFPAFTSGVDSLRLNQAANGVATFFGSAMNRSVRRQLVMEVAISKVDNTLVMRSSEPGFERRLDLPDGITIVDVLPALVDDSNPQARSFFMYPGGTVPQFGVRLSNRRHAELIVSVDPMTGVPHIERP